MPTRHGRVPPSKRRSSRSASLSLPPCSRSGSVPAASSDLVPASVAGLAAPQQFVQLGQNTHIQPVPLYPFCKQERPRDAPANRLDNDFGGNPLGAFVQDFFHV